MPFLGIEGVMKRILYLNPNPLPQRLTKFSKTTGTNWSSPPATWMRSRWLRSERLNAVVIDQEDENPEVLDFTLQARCLRPELPVFLTVDWGAELSRIFPGHSSPVTLLMMGCRKGFGSTPLSDRLTARFNQVL